MKLKIFYPIAIVVMLGVGVSWAQTPSKSELEKKKSSILNEISDAQNLLNETKKEKEVTLSQLKALQAKVQSREYLIQNINQEVNYLNNNITTINNDIKSLEAKVDNLKNSYAKSVRSAYKYQSAQNILMFILTADNFNDAVKRYQYMKKSRDIRKHQANILKDNQHKLSKNINTIKQNLNQKVQLKSVEEVEKSKLLEEKNATDQMVAQLKSKEIDLTSNINKKKADAKKLDNTIKSIIEKEIALARKKALEEENRKKELARIAAEEEKKRNAEALAKKQAQEAALKLEEQKKKELIAKAEADKKSNINPDNSNTIAKNANAPTKITNNNTNSNTTTIAKTNVVASKPIEPPKKEMVNTPPVEDNIKKPATPNYKNSLTPEVQNMSNSFASSRGSLPWPVATGFISAPFGKYPHPLEPKVMLENSGIDISTNLGTSVRTVFQGTVSKIVNIAGTYTVVINHGEYFTVYSYLSGVSVSEGQKLSAKQAIGQVGKNDDGESVVHFEICKVGNNNNIINENPSNWISR